MPQKTGVFCAAQVTAGTDGEWPQEQAWAWSSAPHQSRRDDIAMSHAYVGNFVHCVFSTKDRLPIIPTELKEKLWAYVGGIAVNLGVTLMAVGGTNNHLHLLILLPSRLPLAEVVQKLKANSSRWLGEQGVTFAWQKGYGAFSVSPSVLDKVRSYIHHQADHHKKRNFDEEFIALLRSSGISFDEHEALL